LDYELPERFIGQPPLESFKSFTKSFIQVELPGSKGCEFENPKKNLPFIFRVIRLFLEKN